MKTVENIIVNIVSKSEICHLNLVLNLACI